MARYALDIWTGNKASRYALINRIAYLAVEIYFEVKAFSLTDWVANGSQRKGVDR